MEKHPMSSVQAKKAVFLEQMENPVPKQENLSIVNIPFIQMNIFFDHISLNFFFSMISSTGCIRIVENSPNQVIPPISIRCQTIYKHIIKHG